MEASFAVTGDSVVVAARRQHLVLRNKRYTVEYSLPSLLLNHHFTFHGQLQGTIASVTSIYSDKEDDAWSDDRGEALLELIRSPTLQGYLNRVRLSREEFGTFVQALRKDIVAYTMKRLPNCTRVLTLEDLKRIGVTDISPAAKGAMSLFSQYMVARANELKAVSAAIVATRLKGDLLGLQYLLKKHIIVVEPVLSPYSVRFKRYEVRDAQNRLWRHLLDFDERPTPQDLAIPAGLKGDQPLFFHALMEKNIVLLSGIAGAGKTECIMRLVQTQPCVVLSFMHRARTVLQQRFLENGMTTPCVSTCHTFFGNIHHLDPARANILQAAATSAKHKHSPGGTVSWKDGFLAYCVMHREDITFLVLEESSTLSVELLVRTLDAAAIAFPNLKVVVLAGDQAQLLPINSEGGHAFHTLVEMAKLGLAPFVSHIALNQSVRTNVGVIESNNTMLRRHVLRETRDVPNLVWQEGLYDLHVVQHQDTYHNKTVSRDLVDMYVRLYKAHDRHVWLICALNVEVDYYNAAIHRELFNTTEWVPNTPLLAYKSDPRHHIYNGDSFILVGRTYKDGESGYVLRDMRTNATTNIFGNDTRSLKLGYAQTAHKSQGGEEDIVIVSLISEFAYRKTRDVFTATSRAKGRVIVAVKHADALRKLMASWDAPLDKDLCDVYKKKTYLEDSDDTARGLQRVGAIDEDLKSCGICCEDMGLQAAIVLVCKHYVCESCFQKMNDTQNNSCPFCRLVFEDDSA